MNNEERNHTLKKFKEIGFIEAAMFGFITALKFYDSGKNISFNKAAALFCQHFNIELGDIDLDSSRINYYRTQDRVKCIISNRKISHPFPSQVTEVMRELNFILNENNVAIKQITEKCEFINKMINKIENDGRR